MQWIYGNSLLYMKQPLNQGIEKQLKTFMCDNPEQFWLLPFLNVCLRYSSLQIKASYDNLKYGKTFLTTQ